MTAQQLPVEVTSTQAIYLKEGNVLPFPGTQCMYTEIEGEQVCFGNNATTQIRLQPTKSMKLGLSPQSISQLKYNASLPPPPPELLPGQVIFPEFDSGTRAVATEIQKGVDRHYEITEAVKQSRRLRLFRSSGEYIDGVVNEDEQEEEDETTEWYALEESENEPDDSNETNIRYDEPAHGRIPLKPDTRYCILRRSHNKSQISSASPCDGEGATGNEGNEGNEGKSSTENTKNQEEENEGTSENTSESMGTEETQHVNFEPCPTCGGSFCEHLEFYFDAPKAVKPKAVES
ncbi:MAG: hypothetical protein ACR2PX_23680, partial [Endozoicomonas sp.]|uniref:hypothetical protein n=1 Tax=Endozoicomonas sp. TaxID=1892382 RepID=UPI003D9BD5EE